MSKSLSERFRKYSKKASRDRGVQDNLKEVLGNEKKSVEEVFYFVGRSFAF